MDNTTGWKSDPGVFRRSTFGVESDVCLINSFGMDERLTTRTNAIVGRTTEELVVGRSVDADELIDIEPYEKQDSKVFSSLFRKDVFSVHSDPSLVENVVLSSLFEKDSFTGHADPSLTKNVVFPRLFKKDSLAAHSDTSVINNMAVEDNLAEKSDLSFNESFHMDEKLVAEHATTIGKNVEEMLEVVDIIPDNKLVSEVFPFHKEHPMCGKLSPSRTVSLSLEPMCNTYGIISRNAVIRSHVRVFSTTPRNNPFFSNFLLVFQDYFGI